jgi:superfamily II DNA/RNA helicase
VLCASAGCRQLAYTVLHLQRHEELAAKMRELLLDELNALAASDATPHSGDWRAIVFCRSQRLCSDLARAFGAAAHHGSMGAAERVDALAEWQLGRQPAQRILFATTAAMAIDWAHV